MSGKPLEGHSAIVTGASRGFGAEIGRALARAGAAVTLTARGEKALEAVSSEIRHAGGRAQALAGDVASLAFARSLHALHVREFGTPTILVNCAGAQEPFGPIGVIDPARWWRTQEVNVLGPLQLMTLVLPGMQAARHGTIINVCSMDAVNVRAHHSAYCVSKSTLLRLSEHVAQENVGNGVFVYPIHPGVGMTGLAEEVLGSAEARQWVPEFVDLVTSVKTMPNNPDGPVRCGERCVALATGKYQHLSGTLLNFHAFYPDS